MYEDSAVELQAFASHERVFCIAAAGCTARALAAAGHHVTAVDINPKQVAYAQSRAAGEPAQEGAAERLLSRGRSFLNLLGWSERKRRAFLRLDDPAAQVAYWDRNLDSRRWRAIVDTLLSRSLLRFTYARSFVDSLPPDFSRRIRARLRRCWATHPNRSNPYAWSMLLEERRVDRDPPARHLQFACADAASYLESCAVASFDAFSLSNIVDGASPAYIRRLQAAVRHAAAPGATVVTRSFAEPTASSASNWAARDRSFLWGIVEVLRLGEI
jgi:S-adenosylmethionine:diacylglycerol 3-amino-3-carboxypropyl transferase